MLFVIEQIDYFADFRHAVCLINSKQNFKIFTPLCKKSGVQISGKCNQIFIEQKTARVNCKLKEVPKDYLALP